MISRLRGEVVTRSPSGVVVDVGGVGYLVNPTASLRSRAEPGGEVVAETYLHVREDALPKAALAKRRFGLLLVQLEPPRRREQSLPREPLPPGE